MIRGSPCLPLLFLSALAAPGSTQSAPELERPRPAVVRGVTISTHRSGGDWGSDEIVPTMEQIRDVGADWVAIHPYAGIREDGTVRIRGLSDAAPPEYLVRPIREAHALGLEIMIKPHLAYWGSKFGWRGEIEFASDEEWQRFWTGYRGWIVELARICKDADAFVVGTELDRTVRHEAQWREIIAAVRQETAAPLTYAANWDAYEGVPFWDALDVVGIQAYFPLSNEPGASEAQLEDAWRARMTQLRGYARERNRRIVFTELGYNRSLRAPIEPWASHTDGDEALPVQLACMRAALRAIEAEPVVVGSFLWKWFTWPNRHGGNFRLDTPEMKDILRGVWRDTR